MILHDEHIAYLQEVKNGNIKLWWAPGGQTILYVNSKWSENRKPVDQKLASQLKALGLTKVVAIAESAKKPTHVQLTARGEQILIDELEAWDIGA